MTETAKEPVERHERVHDPAALAVIGRVFRVLNRWMVVLWRLGLGSWAEVYPPVGGRILVLEHRGRKSGITYRTPLNFARSEGSVQCLAAFGPGADWNRNVMSMDEAIVWLPDGRWLGVPVDVSELPNRVDTIRRVLMDTGLAAPAFGMYPRTMSDAELAEASSGYRIVRIDLVERLDSGPADLAWIWPVGAIAVSAGLAAGRVALRRRR